MIIEAQVHSSLLGFLRTQDQPAWPHHLTMARLVARALRLQRSTLIQTAQRTETYSWSYLTPALLWEETVLLITPLELQSVLLDSYLPQLLAGLEIETPVGQGDRIPENFHGLWLTTPASWLRDRINPENRFPEQIPTIIDPADHWEEWTRKALTQEITVEDWNTLIQKNPYPDQLLPFYQKLSEIIFKHPPNPYHCHLIDQEEKEILTQVFQQTHNLPGAWQQFQKRWESGEYLLWTQVSRSQRTFTLNAAPVDVGPFLQPLWNTPIILIGGFLDWEKEATNYRQQIGLGELTCIQFSPNRQSDHIQLYLPDRLPLPNSREFQPVLLEQVLRLCRGGMVGQRYRYRKTPEWISPLKRPVVVLVEDVPLRSQVGTTLAAEFGSTVCVESAKMQSESILVSGWDFWQTHQDYLPTPQLMIIATLPLPSTENPLVAGRVAYHKKHHQDWFRCYLLPTALRELQQAVLPLRQQQGVVALLDNRVNHRSYGSKILSALEPMARINYIDFQF